MRPQAGGVILLGCPTTNSPIPHPLSEQRSVTQLSPVGNASVRPEMLDPHVALFSLVVGTWAPPMVLGVVQGPCAGCGVLA